MKLSEKQAFQAMYLFLEKHYQMTGADDIGSLLGVLSLSEDGKTIDPALWEDWLAAVESVAKGIDESHFKLRFKNK